MFVLAVIHCGRTETVRANSHSHRARRPLVICARVCAIGDEGSPYGGDLITSSCQQATYMMRDLKKRYRSRSRFLDSRVRKKTETKAIETNQPNCHHQLSSWLKGDKTTMSYSDTCDEPAQTDRVF